MGYSPYVKKLRKEFGYKEPFSLWNTINEYVDKKAEQEKAAKERGNKIVYSIRVTPRPWFVKTLHLVKDLLAKADNQAATEEATAATSTAAPTAEVTEEETEESSDQEEELVAPNQSSSKGPSEAGLSFAKRNKRWRNRDPEHEEFVRQLTKRASVAFSKPPETDEPPGPMSSALSTPEGNPFKGPPLDNSPRHISNRTDIKSGR